jgi:Zn-dependent membrane protease YugP
MRWRHALVPVVNLISTLAMPMFLAGIFFAMVNLALVAVILYAATTLFHLVTLPVEYDASARAIRILDGSGMVTADEMVGVRKVLYAAGFTYLAATLVSLAELIYWLLRSGVLGGRDE